MGSLHLPESDRCWKNDKERRIKTPNNDVFKGTNLARLYDDMSEKIVKESEDFEGRLGLDTGRSFKTRSPHEPLFSFQRFHHPSSRCLEADR
ncbi:hypothetical protein TNCV_165491 [Trichonephila clavipes]|nr:hypothetical protein TNCV_165491 [Trichonephila clavipes]